MLHLHAVVANETVPIIVLRHSELSAAVGPLEPTDVRLKTKVGSAEIDGGMVEIFRRRDPPADQSPRDIDPAIETQLRMTRAVLRVGLGRETGQQHLVAVGPAIAVAIFKINQIGSASDQQPIAPREQTVGIGQPIGEGGPAVELAVAIGVFEHGNAAGRDGPGRVSAILGHEHSSPRVERHRHGTLDQRLGGDQLNANARIEPKGGQFFFGRQGRLGRGPHRGGRSRPVGWGVGRRGDRGRNAGHRHNQCAGQSDEDDPPCSATRHGNDLRTDWTAERGRRPIAVEREKGGRVATNDKRKK